MRNGKSYIQICYTQVMCLHYMRAWESIVCVILSGLTGILVKALSIYYSAIQVHIELGQVPQT